MTVRLSGGAEAQGLRCTPGDCAEHGRGQGRERRCQRKAGHGHCPGNRSGGRGGDKGGGERGREGGSGSGSGIGSGGNGVSESQTGAVVVAVVPRSFRSVSKYVAVLALSVENAAAYFADTLVRTIFMAVVIFVFVLLWRTTYSVTGHPTIAGFSVAQMIWYLVITESIINGRVRYWRKMDEEVRSGQIAYSLNKPVNYLVFHYATFLGESVVKVGANLLIGSAVALLMVGSISVPLEAAPFVIASMLLGLTVDYMTEAAIGLLAFWVEDTAPFGLIYNCLALILGGTLLPLDLFPAALRSVAAALPMNQVVYAPARMFASFSSSQPFAILMGQVAWVVVMGCALSCVFRLGRRRLDVNGG